MQSKMKTAVTAFIAAAAVLILLPFCAGAEGYRTLKKGDSGRDVYAFKQRMYELGYFNAQKMSDEYNATTVERVKLLQQTNGLEQTGTADPALQELVFSSDCIPKNGSRTAAASATAAPQAPVQGEEHILKDPANGKWMYESASLRIEITRRTDTKNRLRWYETEVWCSEECPLTTWLSTNKSTPGAGLQKPVDAAKKNGYVLAISDDYYAFRTSDKKNGIPEGIIIRNGSVMHEKTFTAHKGRYPNLETLAVFSDGSMKTFLSDEHTAAEYLEMGATNVFSFGPVLVHDGKLGEDIQKDNYYHYREPRQAIGMIEPYHYLIVTVDGRLEKENIRGVYLDWLGSLMLERGCTEALNLDGGGTAILIFMGERLNKTGSSIRSLNSMIVFGVSAETLK